VQSAGAVRDDFLIRFEVEDTGIRYQAALKSIIFSRRSIRLMLPPRANMAVPVWGWPSASSWWN